MKYFYITLVTIVLISLFLRTYNLDTVPAGLSNDEISSAYNAYSILETGKDEYGVQIPLSFRSHNDFKPPTMIYMIAALIPIFGNTEWSVRLPSAILGTFTVLFLSFLIYDLTKDKSLSLWSALLLGISPWHIYTSRIGYESNIALFFLVTGLYLFFIALRMSWYIPFAALVLAASMYSYHAERVVTPLILLVVFFLKKDIFIKHKKNFLIFFILIILLIPLAQDLFAHRNESTRFRTQVLTNDPKLGNLINDYDNSTIVDWIITFKFWLDKYLSHLDPIYLFFQGIPVPSEFSSQQYGLLYPIHGVLIAFGIFYAFKSLSFANKFMLLWMITSPVVPSLTLGKLSFERDLISVIPYMYFGGLGIVNIIGNVNFKMRYCSLQSNRLKGLLVIIILTSSVGFFMHDYMKHFPFQSAENWSYGFKQIAEFANGNRYDRVIIDPNYGASGHPLVGVHYLYLLYFNQYDPEEYLTTKKMAMDSFAFFNYTVRTVSWPSEKVEPNTLYIVGIASNPIVSPPTPTPVNEVYSIYLPDGKKAFKFYESTIK